MKNALIIVLAVVSLTFGTLYLRQSQKAFQTDATISKLKSDVAETTDQLQQQQQVNSNLEARLRQTRATAVAKAEHAAELEQTMTNKIQAAEAKAKSSNPFGDMAEMFKNPEMKDMIKSQQKAVLGPMIDKNYAAYFATLQLTPEQSSAFKDLLFKKMTAGADLGVSFMTGESDPAKREQMVKDMQDQQNAIDQQIKEFLGDDNYAQFQEYEKTQPARMSINSFKDQLGSGPNALTPEQENQLLQVMSRDRQNFKFTTDFADQSKFNGDFASYFTDEKVSRFQKELEELDGQYATAAQQILSPAQFEDFQKFLKSQRDMQSIGLKMAAKMFGAQSSK